MFDLRAFLQHVLCAALSLSLQMQGLLYVPRCCTSSSLISETKICCNNYLGRAGCALSRELYLEGRW